MDKHELVGLTLERLLANFRESPESFEYHDSERTPNRSCQPTIVFQPKIQLTDYMGTIVHDPNNNHAVVAGFNHNNNELICYLFLKSPADISGTKADGAVSSKRWFEKYRSNYRKFCKLRDLIIARDIYKENMSYLKKLSSIFTDAMDKHIL